MFAPVVNHVPHLLDTLRKIFHRWTIRESHIFDALASTYVAYFTGIYVEENPGNTDDFMFDALLKEAKAIVDRRWQRRKISPDVKCRCRLPLNSDADFR
mmetsp:Transcript_9215/g.15140  ORF Transcript_9215/g.15140 Transcript_9215/m.15140 type:complete len:99 (-) Transcript_9215:1247-1543(-)